MLSEDFIAFVEYKEKYTESQQNLTSLNMRYNQLELEIVSGSALKNSGSITWISLDDLGFDKVQPGFSYTDLEPESISFDLTSDFKLASPSFSGLLDLGEEKYGYEEEFPNWLAVQIRGLYDSKYYEHLLCNLNPGKSPTRFPDFVYTWIGNFRIDDKSRQVTELPWWKKEAVDSLRIKFLLALKLADTKKVWGLVGNINTSSPIQAVSTRLQAKNKQSMILAYINNGSNKF